ncbi:MULTISPECIES: hypothetical protein [unclassified Francisella]|uniref:hypothetical protein n=1 Tax=unclassified Francisella TaxID=2610885 RepID=UPI002E3259D5|nr:MULTISPECIES: hypothetical protein [unclassified Francisella]MED7818851.1 hypothetical protein [Francisella sp. 19S2-4]MED7829694.1 hypothetical protein [Francisella sp. 19S2-10]
MKKIKQLLFIACFLLPLNGYSSLFNDIKKNKTNLEFASLNYPWIFSSVRKDIIESNLKEALKQNNDIGNVQELKNLNELETGRLLQLDGSYQDSINSYNEALKSVPTNKDEFLKKTKEILLSKDTYSYYNIKSAYNIPDYEITFLYTYQALNYLKTNNIKEALKSLDSLDNASRWYEQQLIINDGMKELAKKSLKENDITDSNLGIENFKALNEMISFSKRIPNAYGNPMSYYLKAMLESAVSRNYEKAASDLYKAQNYTVGNKYLNQTINEFKSAMASQTSPFPMGMGRIVVFYEQGLVNVKKSQKIPLDLGNVGIKKIRFPIYQTNYNFFDPKKVIISTGNTTLVDTYTETLLDGTLFAIKSLVEEYPRIITQNVVIEAVKHDYGKGFALGGLLGSHLKFNLSKTDPKRADLRSWLLIPNSVDLFEQEIDGGSYTIQVNNVRQKIDVKQGKTTLLWIVEIGEFKKVYYFIF